MYEDLEQEYLLNDDTLVALRGRKKQIDDKIRHYEAEQERIKEKIINEYLEDGVLPSSGVIHVRKVPQSVIVTDEAKIPNKFFKIKRELDKKTLNEAFKQGEQIEGVTLSNGGYTLAIRGKKCHR